MANVRRVIPYLLVPTFTLIAMKLPTLLLLLIGLLFSGYTGETYEYVQVINWRYKPIIKTTLNGKKAYFLIDTGSDITVLHSKRAERFDFQPLIASSQKLQAMGFNGDRHTVYKATDVKLVIGTMPIKALYKTYDLSGVVRSIHNRVGIDVAGIIGSDVMKRYGFIIDYQKQTIAIKTKRK